MRLPAGVCLFRSSRAGAGLQRSGEVGEGDCLRPVQNNRIHLIGTLRVAADVLRMDRVVV